MELLKLALLRQILLTQNPNATVDPQTLLAQANCYSCYGATPGMMQLLELALLDSIATSQAAAGTLFTSALFALTTNNWSAAHGLSAKPSQVRAVLVCVTNDANSGYKVGDEVDPPAIGNAKQVPQFGANATNVFASTTLTPVGSEGTYQVVQKDGGGPIAPSSYNNFRLKFYARL